MSLRATHPSACATMASTFLSAAEDARAASSRASRAAASAVSLAASILSMLSLHAVSRRLARSSSASSAGTRARSAARSSSRSLTAQAASSAARFAAASATAARPLKLTTMPIATPNESVAHINPKRASGASPLVAHAAALTAMPATPRAATRPPRALAAAASVDGDTHAKRSATMHADCAAMIAIRIASAAADTDAAAAEDMVRPRNHVPALACAGTSRLVCLCAFCSGGRRGPRAARARPTRGRGRPAGATAAGQIKREELAAETVARTPWASDARAMPLASALRGTNSPRGGALASELEQAAVTLHAIVAGLAGSLLHYTRRGACARRAGARAPGWGGRARSLRPHPLRTKRCSAASGTTISWRAAPCAPAAPVSEALPEDDRPRPRRPSRSPPALPRRAENGRLSA